ncbi:MAG: hypothetical protein ACJAZO_003674 [Myxococcota bacterium]|jgi:hypothetical protein
MLVLIAALALADIPPPNGYQETCTVDLVCPSAQGVACSASFNDRDTCERDWGTKGYSKACQTRGASTWSEVWCSNAAPLGEPAGEPVIPTEPVTPSEPGSPDVRKSSRCSSLTGSATWMFAMVGLLGLRRRQ